MIRFCLMAIVALAVHVTPLWAAPLIADFDLGQYWYGFSEYWLGMLRQQNGITMVVFLVGAVSIFIITRGKWKK